jgi:hypothetical protein
MDVPSGSQRPNHGRALSVRVLGTITITTTFLLGACATDPVYFGSNPPAMNVDPAGQQPDAGADAAPGAISGLILTVPVAVETADDIAARTDLATQLGLTPDQVAKVRRDDTDLEIEWTVTNLTSDNGRAQLMVNAANEFFRYDPTVFADPTDQEAQPPPSLLGGKPILLPPGESVSGLFREDELFEASQDLDAITRAGIVPEFAILTRWKTDDIMGGTGGELTMVPSAAIPLILQLNLNLDTDVASELKATLRVRDRSGRLRPTEEDMTLLVAPSTAIFMPPPPMMMP